MNWHLLRKTASDKSVKRGLASMLYKLFDKKSSGGAVTCARSETLSTQDKSAIESKIILNIIINIAYFIQTILY